MIKITKRGSKAWVTFTAPETKCEEAFIKGSWNDWEAEALKEKKNGERYITKVLRTGESYEFGYEIDGRWVADEECESCSSPYGSKNSVLKL